MLINFLEKYYLLTSVRQNLISNDHSDSSLPTGRYTSVQQKKELDRLNYLTYNLTENSILYVQIEESNYINLKAEI